MNTPSGVAPGRGIDATVNADRAPPCKALPVAQPAINSPNKNNERVAMMASGQVRQKRYAGWHPAKMKIS
jgi:hypothetical protein